VPNRSFGDGKHRSQIFPWIAVDGRMPVRVDPRIRNLSFELLGHSGACGRPFFSFFLNTTHPTVITAAFVLIGSEHVPSGWLRRSAAI
jgi:hypothetical protein